MRFRSGAISGFTAGARRRNRARAIQGKTLNIDLPAAGDPTAGNCRSSLTWEFNTGSFSGGVTPACGDKEGDRAGHLLRQGTFICQLGSYSSTKKRLANSGRTNSNTDFAELRHKVTPRLPVHPLPLKHHVLSPRPFLSYTRSALERPEAGKRFLLGGGVVELVLSGSAEAGLHPAVPPQPFNDAGQLGGHHAFLRAAREHEQLAGIVLQETGNQSLLAPTPIYTFTNYSEAQHQNNPRGCGSRSEDPRFPLFAALLAQITKVVFSCGQKG